MQEWASLFSAAGAFVIALGGREIVAGWLKRRSGKAEEEAKRIKEAIDENRRLKAENESHYTKERIFKEYSSELRILLINKGVPQGEIPPWPI